MYAHTLRAVVVVAVGVSLAHPASTHAQTSCGEVQSGVAETGLSASKGAQRCFWITVPALQTGLSVGVSGGSGNADLYVRYGAPATTRAYDCRSTVRSGTDRCDVAAPAGGTWYVMLSAQTAFSGASLTVTFQDASTTLQNGVPQPVSATQGTQRFFKIAVPSARKSLTVTLAGGTGNGDLYVGSGAWPTLKASACRSARRTNDETCTINSPAPGPWYVMVNATTSISGASLTAAFDTGLTLVSGGGQVGAVNTTLANPVVVRVDDPRAQPLPGQAVSFSVTAGGGVTDASAVTTAADGTASVAWTLGPTRIPQELTVSATDPVTSRPTVLKITASAAGKLIVNSLADPDPAPPGALTLRLALATASSGETIAFAADLDGKTIELFRVGEAHSTLRGEVYSGMTYVGYADRDYGRSALYARKDVVLDASALPAGVTLHWNGGATHARVLGVYGNLTMKNVNVSSGYSVAESTGNTSQTYTLARGGGLAVWGTATLRDCRIVGNVIDAGAASGRDMAAYGGGIFANGLDLQNCIVSGNRAVGSGAAGGGIYSVGGPENTTGYGNDTFLDRCVVSGNFVQGANAYGGGIFTLSGGPTNLATMRVANSTVARNLVTQTPGSPTYFYRGGGIYMGGGSLEVVASTIAENEVYGTVKMDTTDPSNPKPAEPPNVGGGGVAATIGNAHTVEYVWLQNSIVVGNKLNGQPQDWFVGSLIEFNSRGYNLVGKIDFTQILVPIPAWMDLSRKHWPVVGDLGGSQMTDVLGAPTLDGTITSAGTDAGGPAVLWYAPLELARDKIPVTPYQVTYVYGGYTGYGTASDDFLNRVIQRVEEYGVTLPSEFASKDRTGITWYGPARTWPSVEANQPWILFWRDLDKKVAGQLRMELLADDFWETFQSGPLDATRYLSINRSPSTHSAEPWDQTGKPRPSGSLIDIGAIEQ